MAISPVTTPVPVVQNQPGDMNVSNVSGLAARGRESGQQTREAVEQTGQMERGQEARGRDRVSLDGRSVPGGASERAQGQKQTLEDAVDSMNQFLGSINKNLEFSIDDETSIRVVRLIDRGNNNEVIRQIPSEEMLAIAQAIDKFRGMLIREEA